MGQYFILLNVTKKESAKPGFANWKIGGFDFKEISTILGWLDTDEILAIGDNGDVINYSAQKHSIKMLKDEGILKKIHEENEDGNSENNHINNTSYKMRYIQFGKEVPAELNFNEFQSLLKLGSSRAK